MTARSQPIVLSFFLLVVGCAFTLLFNLNPEKVLWFPQCPFHWLTGLDCPGCGSMRGLHCLLHGKILQAAGHNLLLLPAILMLAFGFYFKVTGKAESLWQYCNKPRIVLIVVICFWVLRNLPFYPFSCLSAGR